MKQKSGQRRGSQTGPQLVDVEVEMYPNGYEPPHATHQENGPYELHPQGSGVCSRGP